MKEHGLSSFPFDALLGRYSSLDGDRTGKRRSHRSVMATVLDCDLEVNEFEHQSRNYIHFRTLKR